MTKRRKTLGGSGLTMEPIEPLTHNQQLTFESDKHLMLHGAAGTGKTLMSMYLAFEDMVQEEYRKLVIVRSAVPTRDIGFLPGTEKDKAAVYEEPYKDIAQELFDRGDAYEVLKTKSLVHFMTTSFIRGTTLRDCVLLVDECQNMTYQELDSIMTRVGENCRVIFCGDFRQSDLKDSGIKKFFDILKKTREFDFIDFHIDDIVRSGLVKKYLTCKYGGEVEEETPYKPFEPITYESALKAYNPI